MNAYTLTKMSFSGSKLLSLQKSQLFLRNWEMDGSKSWLKSAIQPNFSISQTLKELCNKPSCCSLSSNAQFQPRKGLAMHSSRTDVLCSRAIDRHCVNTRHAGSSTLLFVSGLDAYEFLLSTCSVQAPWGVSPRPLSKHSPPRTKAAKYIWWFHQMDLKAHLRPLSTLCSMKWFFS